MTPQGLSEDHAAGHIEAAGGRALRPGQALGPVVGRRARTAEVDHAVVAALGNAD